MKKFFKDMKTLKIKVLRFIVFKTFKHWNDTDKISHDQFVSWYFRNHNKYNKLRNELREWKK